MRGLFTSDFFRRFAGGFALGAVALVAMQPGAVAQNVAAIAKPAAARTA